MDFNKITKHSKCPSLLSSVVQINLGKRKAASVEASRNKCDILLVTEPHTARGKVAGLEPMGNVYAWGKGTPRTCIRTNLKAWLIEEFTDEDITTISVTGVDGVEDTVFASVYLDITKPVEMDQWSRLLRWCDSHKKPLVMGIDSNAHSEMWGSTDLNHRGEILEEVIMRYDLTIHNRGKTPTFTGGSGTVIDITLSNQWFGSISSIKDWRVDQTDSMSDHRYINFTVDAELHHPEVPRRNTRKADWNIFKAALERIPLETVSPLDETASTLDRQANALQTAMTKALEEACPSQIPKPPKVNRWWTPTLQELRDKTNKAGRRKNKHPDLHKKYVEARRTYTKAIAAAKREAWRTFCSKAETAGDVAKLIKCLEAKPPRRVSLFQKSGQTVTSNESLEVLLHTHFPSHMKLGDNGVTTPDMELDFTGVVQYTNLQRVKQSIETFGDYKTAGPDGLQPVVLKHLPKEYLERIVLLYQLSLASGHIPKCWREMNVIFIPKMGKSDYADPKAYRPITLSNFILKTLERVVQWFINDHIITKPLVNQHAYTRGRSTETALSDFINQVEASFLRKKHAIAISLDCSGAFDTVSFDAASAAMQRKNIPKNISSWYDNLLRNRIVTAEVQGVKATIAPGKGSPQGGVLSPMIWNIVMDSLLCQLTSGPVKAIGYADDIMLIATGIDVDSISSQLQQTLNTVHSWGLSQGLTFNPTKTAVVHFNPTREKRSLRLSMGGKNLDPCPSMKYLGVTINERLTWDTHINDRIGKCRFLLQKSKALIGQHWGLDPQKCMWTYRAMVRPKLVYGSLVWASKLTRAQRHKLQRLQRLALLSMTHPMRSTPTKGMEAIVGLLPLDLFVEREAAKARLRIRNLVADSTNKWDGLGAKSGTRGHQRHWDDILREVIPVDLATDYMPARRNDFIMDDFQAADLTIYTDGSLFKDGSCGYGFAACKKDTVLEETFGGLENATAFQAEIYAIQKAGEWASLYEKTFKEIKIISDSSSAIEAVISPSVTSNVVWGAIKALQNLQRTTKVMLEWTRGHSGTTGNELADMLAKQGSRSNPKTPIPASATALKSKIKQLFERKWQAGWDNESTCNISRSMLPKVTESRLVISGYARAKLNLICQAVTGHGFFAQHLSKWKTVDPVCKLCEEDEESSLHLWRDCPALERNRRELAPAPNAVKEIEFIYKFFTSQSITTMMTTNEGSI